MMIITARNLAAVTDIEVRVLGEAGSYTSIEGKTVPIQIRAVNQESGVGGGTESGLHP